MLWPCTRAYTRADARSYTCFGLVLLLSLDPGEGLCDTRNGVRHNPQAVCDPVLKSCTLSLRPVHYPYALYTILTPCTLFLRHVHYPCVLFFFVTCLNVLTRIALRRDQHSPNKKK